MKVYADNAATTKMSKHVIETMLPYFDNMYANPSSIHSDGVKVKKDLNNARADIANCIGAYSNEIIFTSGGSESDNQAIISAAYAGKLKGKTHIISSEYEHHAVLHTLKKLETEGFEITLVKVSENGLVDPQSIKEAIKPTTCLVSIMYANNEIGTINPIKEIGEICRKNNVIFHTDAVQAVGHLNIDVKKENIDMLSLSAHKFHGPKGIGALYINSGLKAISLIEGGGQEFGLRAGTENIPGIIGMTTALKDALKNLNKNEKKTLQLRNQLIDKLTEIPNSTINGDVKKRLSGNVNISFDGIESESLLLLLDNNGIMVSSGSACNAGNINPSHVLKSIGKSDAEARSSIRITINEENTEEEICYIADKIKDIVSMLRCL